MSNFFSPSYFEIALFFISIAAGTLGAVLGLGGGVIIIPTLTLLFGINIRYAIGASIISVIATSCGSAAVYVRDRMTNVRVAIFLEIATTFGAITGAVLSAHLRSQFLFVLFAIVLCYSSIIMFRKSTKNYVTNPSRVKEHPWSEKLKFNSSYPENKIEIFYKVGRVKFGFFLMYFAGLLSALLGIGSGSLKVPAMDAAMGLPFKVSSATSNFMIGVTAAASAGTYYSRGEILPLLAAPVALGVLVGSVIGTKILMIVPARAIRIVFAVLLLVIAIQMAWKGLGFSEITWD